jgi:hypothetical protein
MPSHQCRTEEGDEAMKELDVSETRQLYEHDAWKSQLKISCGQQMVIAHRSFPEISHI